MSKKIDSPPICIIAYNFWHKHEGRDENMIV